MIVRATEKYEDRAIVRAKKIEKAKGREEGREITMERL